MGPNLISGVDARREKYGRAASVSVSVVIPCQNESRFIGPCLDSVLAGDYPTALMEILVVDGRSTDATRDIVREYVAQHPNIRLLHNPRLSAPAALNIGITSASGEVIVRLDAHTTYSRNYISECVETLMATGASNVGGIIRTLPSRDTWIAIAIAHAMSHPFGVGWSLFRIHVRTMREADTVPFGCFRRSLVQEIGGYNEEMARNEDFELNQRIQDHGGRIVLNREIVSSYYARGTLREFWRHTFDNGYRVTAYLGSGKIRYAARHLAPGVSVGVFLLIAGAALTGSRSGLSLLVLVTVAYAVVSVAMSIHLAIRERHGMLLMLMPCTFGMLHVGYGAGSLTGLAALVQGQFSRLFARLWKAGSSVSFWDR